MLIILKKVTYIYLIFGLNIFFCSYFVSKLSARAELRRGYASSRAGGLGYPFISLFKYMSKEHRLGIWEILLFFFSLFIWSVIPFSQSLILIKFDFDIIAVVLFYLVLVFLIMINSYSSSHGFIYNNFVKKFLMVFTFFIPLLFCMASIILINRTLNLKEIVGSQYQYWNIVFQPLGFIAAVTSVLMQLKLLGLTRRNTILYSENSEKEGNGFGGLVSRVARYSIMFFLMVLIVLLYLAGWERLYFINGNMMFAVKFYILFFILLFIDRATPKLDDYYYLMSINSRFIIPISAVNFLLTMVFFILRNIYNLI